MAVFSRSVFQSVLDRLDADMPEPETGPDRLDSARGLKSGFVFGVTEPETQSAFGSAQDLFGDFDLDPTDIPVQTDVPPAWIGRVTEAEIAEDLGILPGDDRERLLAKRRAFARENHPDRVHRDHASAATLRMMVANRLIDDALLLRKLSGQG